MSILYDPMTGISRPLPPDPMDYPERRLTPPDAFEDGTYYSGYCEDRCKYRCAVRCCGCGNYACECRCEIEDESDD